MNIPLVDLKAQYLSVKDEIDSTLSETVSSCNFVGGSVVKKFERDFADYCGVSECVGVGNGTDALFLALKALGIGQGDEVIVPANSFIATSEAVTMAGARVVFAEMDPVTFNLDIEDFRRKITPHTRAVIPVHLYGRPADMDAILDITGENGLFVVADCAQAHGAEYKGKPVAKLCDIACYSFYPGKNLGAYGDGGAVATDKPELAEKVRLIANHGRMEKYNHLVEGVNSRLDSIQAAVLGVKLRYLEQWTNSRIRNAELYNRYLSGLNLKTPSGSGNSKAVYHLYVVRVDATKRQSLQDYLSSHGISTGIHYPIGLPFLEAYSHLGHEPKDFPETYKASGEILSLPMYPELTEDKIAFITEKIRDFGL